MPVESLVLTAAAVVLAWSFRRPVAALLWDGAARLRRTHVAAEGRARRVPGADLHLVDGEIRGWVGACSTTVPNTGPAPREAARAPVPLSAMQHLRRTTR